MRGKRHLYVSPSRRAACGEPNVVLNSRRPDQVTCNVCLRSVYMADALVKADQKRK